MQISVAILVGGCNAILGYVAKTIKNFQSRVLSYPNSIFEAKSCLNTTLTNLNIISLLDDSSLITTPNAVNSGLLYSVIPNNGNGDMTVVRATTATRVNSAGIIESVASNVPRLNYDVAGGCPSILLEPQRTNLVTYSEDFSNATWNSVNSGISENIVTSPSNLLDGDILTEGTTNNVHSITNGTVVTSGVNNTVSLYVKKNNLSFFRLVLGDNITTTSWVCAQFNLDTLTYTSGVGTTGGVFVSASITSAGNGWYRCVLVGNIPTNGTALFGVSPSNGNAITSSDSRGRVSYLGIGRTIYIWGAQSETGSYQTSYIPTVASTVTRNADSIGRNKIYTNGLITSAGGTWFVELVNNFSLIRDLGSQFSISQASTIDASSGFSLRANPGSSRISIYRYISGSAIQLHNTTTDLAKIAIKWNGLTADVFVNGVKVVSSTTFTTTNMEFFNGLAGDLPKYVKSTLLFPTPLSDAECISMTT